jgi:hypothetical protein
MGLIKYIKGVGIRKNLKKASKESNEQYGIDKFYSLGNLAEQQYKLKLYGDAKKTLELTLDQGRKYRGKIEGSENIEAYETKIQHYENLYENVLQKIGDKKEPRPKEGLEARTTILSEYSTEKKSKMPIYQEVITGAISVIGLVGGSMILFPTTTGNVIGNLNESTGDIFGIVFILIGLTGLFILLKKDKKAFQEEKTSSKKKEKFLEKRKNN